MRYKKNLSEYIRVRVSENDKEMITELCQKTGLDESKLIRLAINYYYEQNVASYFRLARNRLLSHSSDLDCLKAAIYYAVNSCCKLPNKLPHLLTINYFGYTNLYDYLFFEGVLQQYDSPELLAKAWDNHYINIVITDYVQYKINERQNDNNLSWNESDILKWKEEAKTLHNLG